MTDYTHSLITTSPYTSLQVQYYGLIKQVTGEDWENAKISLSTAQPSVGGSAPPLPTKIIRFKRPKPRYYPMSAAAAPAPFSISLERAGFDADYDRTGYDPTIVSAA